MYLCMYVCILQVSCEGPLGKTSMFVAASKIDYSEAFKRLETLEPKVDELF